MEQGETAGRGGGEGVQCGVDEAEEEARRARQLEGGQPGQPGSGDAHLRRVADEGSLTGAAQRLFVSQPALTKQIRRLEDDLGVRLFERSRSGMALTEAGRELASRVSALLDGWDEAVRATGRAARVLRLGFLDAGAVGAVPEVIAAFRQAQPE